MTSRRSDWSAPDGRSSKTKSIVGWVARTALATIIFASTGCATASRTLQSDQYVVVESYVQAYNERDLDTMSDLMHSDIQWLSVDGDQLIVVADGKLDLVAQMSEYVVSPAATTSELAEPIFNNQFIATIETAHWQIEGGSVNEQSALVVYEIVTGLVRRVWYYPS